MKLNNLFYDILVGLEIPAFYALIINMILVGLLIIIGVLVLNYISKTFVRNLLEKISINSKNNFDNFLVENNIHIHLSRLVPFVFLYWIIPLWLEEYADLLSYSKLVLELYFIFLIQCRSRLYILTGTVKIA